MTIIALMFIWNYGEYHFVPAVRRVTHQVAGFDCDGYIKSDGSFAPDTAALERSIKASRSNSRANIVSRPASLLDGLSDNQKVYEYQNGMLIPMIYKQRVGMIPEHQGIIIKFEEYKYHPNARVIYNLPGRFMLNQGEPAKKP
jgi:hypothetical protein